MYMGNNTTTPADTRKTPQKCRSPYRADKRQSKFPHSENCTVEVTNRDREGKTQINNPPPSNTHAITATAMQVNILNTHVVKNPSCVSHSKISKRKRANGACKQSYETIQTDKEIDIHRDTGP